MRFHIPTITGITSFANLEINTPNNDYTTIKHHAELGELNSRGLNYILSMCMKFSFSCTSKTALSAYRQILQQRQLHVLHSGISLYGCTDAKILPQDFIVRYDRIHTKYCNQTTSISQNLAKDLRFKGLSHAHSQLAQRCSEMKCNIFEDSA